MNKNWKKKWVEALRSGKYKKGRGALKNRGRYCCLGVLCDIGPTKWHYGTAILGKCRSDLTLPTNFRARLKISDSDENTLMAMNDGIGRIGHGQRTTFKKIADWIERNL
jgi:hypothetical protein